MNISNMTAAEQLRYTGSVDRETLEALVETERYAEAIRDIDANIEEAMCQYPAEDFLQEVLTSLHELMKSVRGSNRDAVQGIIESLDDIAQTTFNAADYGRGELRAALNAVRGKK
jgi:hypothetical protein